MTRRRRGGLKGGVVLFALHKLEHSERFTEFHREEKRVEGDRGDQGERRRNQKERDQPSL